MGWCNDDGGVDVTHRIRNLRQRLDEFRSRNEEKHAEQTTEESSDAKALKEAQNLHVKESEIFTPPDPEQRSVALEGRQDVQMIVLYQEKEEASVKAPENSLEQPQKTQIAEAALQEDLKPGNELRRTIAQLRERLANRSTSLEPAVGSVEQQLASANTH